MPKKCPRVYAALGLKFGTPPSTQSIMWPKQPLVMLGEQRSQLSPKT